jgi:hypothetical protein
LVTWTIITGCRQLNRVLTTANNDAVKSVAASNPRLQLVEVPTELGARGQAEQVRELVEPPHGLQRGDAGQRQAEQHPRAVAVQVELESKF